MWLCCIQQKKPETTKTTLGILLWVSVFPIQDNSPKKRGCVFVHIFLEGNIRGRKINDKKIKKQKTKKIYHSVLGICFPHSRKLP
jgi:hypothetical protein